MDLNLIRTFVSVCEAGSVTVAARRLKQPKSTISRHLARLEEELDVMLLQRSSSGIALSAEGRRLYEQTRESIHLLEPLGRRATSLPPSGHIRIAAPRYFARGPLTDVIRDFMRECPDVSIELRSENRLAETDGSDVDVQIVAGPMREIGGEVTQLGHREARLFGAPTLFGADGPPRTAACLSGVDFLSSCGTSGVPQRLSLTSDKGQTMTIAPTTRLVTNELSLLLDAARDGLGIVALPEFVGEREVEAGRLVPILPGYWTDRFMVSMALLSGRKNPAARRFADFAMARLERRASDNIML
ncbi:DNA-binding transcriptional regulator, LysR family [Fulvimarina manganoxydans]|uniref:DNA-binding transcriptional regulator, LysR family n=1 Tax=Fulvimarina manganoxydans TaxID=937218 RepID=A0A1W2EMU4_9HYPH|nr:LysR family transcriptional regulator [Fulvimarina manganoxydans]SMD10852.1 DNA-binding transcriptional regulator, LysR family [Fulvimarina manganoxydans]